MDVFWILFIDVVFLSKISAANYISKCVLIAAGSIAISFADLNLYIEDDEEDQYFFVKNQEPKKEEPKEDEGIRMARFHKECLNETKVKPEWVQKLSKGHWKLHIPAPGLKEWAFCVLNKMELMSKQGVYRLDVAFSRIPSKFKQAAEKIIDKCLSVKAIPPLQIAWKYLRCLNDMDPKGEFSNLGVFYNNSSSIK